MARASKRGSVPVLPPYGDAAALSAEDGPVCWYAHRTIVGLTYAVPAHADHLAGHPSWRQVSGPGVQAPEPAGPSPEPPAGAG